MANFQIINDRSEINLGREWKDSPLNDEDGKIAIHEGVRYEIIQKERERGIIEMIGRVALGILLVFFTAFTALGCPYVRDLFSLKEIVRFGKPVNKAPPTQTEKKQEVQTDKKEEVKKSSTIEEMCNDFAQVFLKKVPPKFQAGAQTKAALEVFKEFLLNSQSNPDAVCLIDNAFFTALDQHHQKKLQPFINGNTVAQAKQAFFEFFGVQEPAKTTEPPKTEQTTNIPPEEVIKIDGIFKSIHSATLEVFPVKPGVDISHREDFMKLSQEEGYNPAPPVLSKSSFVSDELVEHLMRNKKNSALGSKYKVGDQITNMEGALHTFLTPLAKINLTGDYAWKGYHAADMFGNNQVRPVILSAAVQPDFEFGNVMGALMKIGDGSVEGKPLPDDFKILSASEKAETDVREAYDNQLRSHLIYHLTKEHRLPALSEIAKSDKLTNKEAIAIIEEAILADDYSKLSQKYINISHDIFIPLEMFFNSYIEQVNNEFKVFEKGAPQGYVYTIDPPSIFVNFLGDATLLNRLQILAFKKINEGTPFKNLKIIGFNDYLDKGAIKLFKAALPEIDVMNKPQALAKLQNTDYVLVLHNNSDAFGQNIETEGPSSMDGLIGSYSDVAVVLKRTRLDLMDFVV